jgi:hypothetical protein
MARVRQHFHYSDTKGELAEYKDARHGAMEDAFWDEDEVVDFPKAGKTKKPKKKRGCPGNDYKAHVYVWVTETRYFSKYNYERGYHVVDFSRPYTVDSKTCCGCGKVDNRRYNW